MLPPFNTFPLTFPPVRIDRQYCEHIKINSFPPTLYHRTFQWQSSCMECTDLGNIFVFQKSLMYIWCLTHLCFKIWFSVLIYWETAHTYFRTSRFSVYFVRIRPQKILYASDNFMFLFDFVQEKILFYCRTIPLYTILGKIMGSSCVD